MIKKRSKTIRNRNKGKNMKTKGGAQQGICAGPMDLETGQKNKLTLDVIKGRGQQEERKILNKCNNNNYKIT